MRQYERWGARDERQDGAQETRRGATDEKRGARNETRDEVGTRETRDGTETTHLCVHRRLSLSEGPETWAGGSEVSHDWAPEAQSYSLGDTPSN